MFEINGKTYTERPQPEKNRRMSRVEMIAMAIGANMDNMYGSNYMRPFPKLTNNSLIDEYRLIQEKKSHLSKAERDMVENRFERMYIEVKGGGNA